MAVGAAIGERMSVRRKGLAVIALPLVALLLTLGLTLLLNSLQVRARGWVDHSYSVRRMVRIVSQDLRDLDLVRVDPHAFPLERGGTLGILGEMRGHLRDLHDLVDDDVEQSRRVDTLVRWIDTIEEGALADPVADFRPLSQEVHRHLDATLAAEEKRLGERRSFAHRLEGLYLVALGLCAILGLGGSWIAITIQTRAILSRLDALTRMARELESGLIPVEPPGVHDEFGVVASAMHRAGVRIQQREHEFRELSERLEDLVIQRTAQLATTNRRLEEENHAREVAEDSLRALASTLEAQVQQRTAELRTANSELESFSYSVSHDLRAPLRHVSGFVALLEKTGGGNFSETQREYLRIIAQASTQMGRLIDDLLAFSRIGRVEMAAERVDMEQLARVAWANIAGEVGDRRIEFRLGALPPVSGDPALLRLVLVNLFSNAAKYTRPREQAVVEIGAEEKSASLHPIFFVRDNGVGYDPKYKDRLFQVFQRLHRAEEFEGTGIGLANVARIVRRHGGDVWSESTPGEGACFWFTLPAAKEE